VEEREFLARVLKRLQDQTRVMRNTLDLHIQGKNINYADLESKRYRHAHAHTHTPRVSDEFVFSLLRGTLAEMSCDES
jgi:competence protein ComGF